MPIEKQEIVQIEGSHGHKRTTIKLQSNSNYYWAKK